VLLSVASYPQFPIQHPCSNGPISKVKKCMCARPIVQEEQKERKYHAIILVLLLILRKLLSLLLLLLSYYYCCCYHCYYYCYCYCYILLCLTCDVIMLDEQGPNFHIHADGMCGCVVPRTQNVIGLQQEWLL
jgi:hypothetical protein